jgi:hypothetical protein
MDQVSKALSPVEIARANAVQAPPDAASKPVARQILPAGFEAERTIPLTVPVEFDGIAYTSVSIRRLKGSDFRLLQQMSGNEDVALLGIVTGLPAAIIDELDANDFIALTEAAQDFLPQKRQAAAGSTSVDGRSLQP